MSQPEIIQIDDLKQKIHSDNPPQMLNVLGPQGWKVGVIPGSILIPKSLLETKWKKLDKGRAVVTYCSNERCGVSHSAARFLIARGFAVSIFSAGIQGWIEAGEQVDVVRSDTGI